MLNRIAVIGIDVGNLNSGIVGLIEGQIQLVKIVENKYVFEAAMDCFKQYEVVRVVVEDIKPYAGNLSQQAIDTCKFIGQLTWRLEEAGIEYVMVTRSTVRKWVYDSFPSLILPLVCKKIERKNAKNNDGKARKPSFVYVEDGFVLKAMKLFWKIEDAPPGKGYIHGLRAHTWQALALASYFGSENPTFSVGFPQISELPVFYGRPAS
jgi:hypothetical protein